MQERLNLGMPRPLETLAQRLVYARKKRHFSQEKLAELSGLKQPDISKLEKGKMLKTTGMARLAHALNVPARWLELGEGDEPDWGDSLTPAHGRQELAYSQPNDQSEVRLRSEPPAPNPGFADSHTLSDSDWQLFDDFRRAATEEEIRVIRQRAQFIREKANELFAERQEAARSTNKADSSNGRKDK